MTAYLFSVDQSIPLIERVIDELLKNKTACATSCTCDKHLHKYQCPRLLLQLSYQRTPNAIYSLLLSYSAVS